jgi:hypothetical protein
VTDGGYFDPICGWVAPSDVQDRDTNRSLKEVIAELKGGALWNDLCHAVEQLLYTYQVFVRQGIRKEIAKHKGVSWYLTESDDGRALISYQDGPGGEWANDCYADEVPLWLLIGLFRKIQRRKPLGDQDADETIASVDDLDAEYEQLKQQPSKLNMMPHRRGDV